MKLIFALAILTLFSTASFAAQRERCVPRSGATPCEEAESIRQSMERERNDATPCSVKITRKFITVTGSVFSSFGPVARSYVNDCANRRTDCYQDGQWMANVSGRGVWVNTDTDDVSGVGDKLNCKKN